MAFFRRRASTERMELPEAPGGRASRGCVALFGLPFLLAGLGILSMGVRQGYQTLFGVKDWKPVEAVVLSKELEAHSDSDGTTYKPVIEYRYEVEGQTYVSKRYRITEVSSSGRAGKQAVLDSYDTGGTYTAYYDPGDPSQAVLTREVSYMFAAIILFGLVFAGVGAGLVFGPTIAGVVKRRREERLAAGEGISPVFDKEAAGPWVFALFWNGVTYTVYLGFVTGGERLPWFLYLFFGLFMVIGATVLAAAVRVTLEHRAFSGLELKVYSAPVRAGETAEWELSDPKGKLAGREVHAYLVMRAEEERLKGKARWRHTRYREELENVNRFGAASAGLSGRLMIPERGELEALLAQADEEGPEPPGGEERWYLRLAIGSRRAHFALPLEGA